MKCLTSLFLLFSLALFTVGCAETTTQTPVDDATTTAPDGTMDEGVVTEEPSFDEPATISEEPAPTFEDPAPVTEPAPAPADPAAPADTEADIQLDPAVEETN